MGIYQTGEFVHFISHWKYLNHAGGAVILSAT